jgi:hypothetical protein
MDSELAVDSDATILVERFKEIERDRIDVVVGNA